MTSKTINKGSFIPAIIELIKMVENENVEVTLNSAHKGWDIFDGLTSIVFNFHDKFNNIDCRYTLVIEYNTRYIALLKGENDEKVNKITGTRFWAYLITIKELLEYYYFD